MATAFLPLSLAAALLAGVPAAAQQPVDGSPAGLGYWNGPDWEALDTDAGTLGILFDASLDRAAIRQLLASFPGLAADAAQHAIIWPGHTVVVPTEDGLSEDGAWELAEHLVQHGSVLEAAPGLVATSTGERLYLTDEILVRWKADTPAGERERWTRGWTQTATLDFTVNPGEVYAIPAEADQLQAVNALAASGLVEFAHPDFRVERISTASTNDALYGDQWHLESTGQLGAGVDQDIDVEGAWDITRGTASVTIAVVDTGVELFHPDLVENLVPGTDVLGNDNDPKAEDGTFLGIFRWQESHSTSVCGVSAGRGDNSIGTTGVAPRCTVMPIRFLSELFGPTPTLQDEADAFNFACANGAAIVNNSWGPVAAAQLPASTKAAIDNCNQNGRNGLGAIIFFAAGNSGSDNSGNGYAAYPGVLGVTATTDQGVKAGYSSFGPTVDCTAPSNGGVNGITTTDRLGTKGYSNGDYTDGFGGTSSASPTAAGVMGLILSANPSLTRDEAIDVLLTTCEKVDLAGGNYNAAGFSNWYGWGRVNATAAVQEAVARATSGASNTVYLNGTTLANPGTNAQYQFSNAPANAPYAALVSTASTSGAVVNGHVFDVLATYQTVAQGSTDANGMGSFSGNVPASALGQDWMIEVVIPQGAGYTDSNGLLLRVF